MAAMIARTPVASARPVASRRSGFTPSMRTLAKPTAGASRAVSGHLLGMYVRVAGSDFRSRVYAQAWEFDTMWHAPSIGNVFVWKLIPHECICMCHRCASSFARIRFSSLTPRAEVWNYVPK
eukprot:7308953-Pyramimonas_sp.AAC.1